MKIASDSWQLEHINLLYPGPHQVAHQKYRTFLSLSRLVQPAQYREIHYNPYSVEDLDAIL
jgi:hypothetical protein